MARFEVGHDLVRVAERVLEKNEISIRGSFYSWEVTLARQWRRAPRMLAAVRLATGYSNIEVVSGAGPTKVGSGGCRVLLNWHI